MKIFRNEGKYRIFLMVISMFATILAYRVICHENEVDIYHIYNIVIGDVFIMGFMLPATSLLVIKMTNACMTGNVLLAQNSRKSWWGYINRKLLKNSFISTGIIVLPTFFLFNFMTGGIETFGEGVYELCLLLSYFIFFYFVGLCIVITKIRFHSGIFALGFVLFISYLPNIIGFLYGKSEIPTISEMLNVRYVLNGNNFYWLYYWNVILILIILLFVLNKIGGIIMKKIDIFWEM